MAVLLDNRASRSPRKTSPLNSDDLLDLSSNMDLKRHLCLNCLSGEPAIGFGLLVGFHVSPSRLTLIPK